VIDVVADFVGSCVLVAVSVAVPAEAGAVKTPLAFTVPLLADQVTAELKLPVPFTVALHCELALTAMVGGVQAGETEEMVEDGEPEWLLLPPQAASTTSSNDIPKACMTGPVARWRPEPPIWTLIPKVGRQPRNYPMLNVIKR
jgi:hypothetical protein